VNTPGGTAFRNLRTKKENGSNLVLGKFPASGVTDCPSTINTQPSTNPPLSQRQWIGGAQKAISDLRDHFTDEVTHLPTLCINSSSIVFPFRCAQPLGQPRH